MLYKSFVKLLLPGLCDLVHLWVNVGDYASAITALVERLSNE